MRSSIINANKSKYNIISQVEREYLKMENDPNRIEHEWNQICDAKECIDSAQAMVPDKITTYTMQIVKQHYLVLKANSQNLPMMHLVLCCKVYCKEASEIGPDVWAKALVPLVPLDNTFDVECPVYGQTQAARLSPENADFKKFVETWNLLAS